MATRDASTKQPSASIVAFPSLSSSLHALPHATSMQNVSLHPNMYAQRAAESEAKLRAALSKTASSYAQNPHAIPSYMSPPPTQSQDSSSPLMMRPKSKS